MDKVDNLILCGGMTYTFAKAKGGNVGTSICESDKLDSCSPRHHEKGRGEGCQPVLATDCVAADAFSNDANTQICSVLLTSPKAGRS